MGRGRGTVGTVHSTVGRVRYFVHGGRGRSRLASGGWVAGWVGWMDACMDGSGWRSPAKQIMIAVTWWVCRPPRPAPFWCLSPGVCLATIDARLVDTPRLSPGCPRRSVIQPWVGGCRCGRVDARPCTSDRPDSPTPPPLRGPRVLHTMPARPLPADLCLRTGYPPQRRPLPSAGTACWCWLLPVLLLPAPWLPCALAAG